MMGNRAEIVVKKRKVVKFDVREHLNANNYL